MRYYNKRIYDVICEINKFALDAKLDSERSREILSRVLRKRRPPPFIGENGDNDEARGGGHDLFQIHTLNGN